MKILIKVNIKPLVKKMPLLSRRGIFLFSDKIEGFSDQIENKKMTSIWKKGIVGLPHHD